jgi:hypothetical protein
MSLDLPHTATVYATAQSVRSTDRTKTGLTRTGVSNSVACQVWPERSKVQFKPNGEPVSDPWWLMTTPDKADLFTLNADVLVDAFPTKRFAVANLPGTYLFSYEEDNTTVLLEGLQL